MSVAKKKEEVTLADIDKAIASVPKPVCFADYGKTYRVLPGGKIEEIKKQENEHAE